MSRRQNDIRGQMKMGRRQNDRRGQMKMSRKQNAQRGGRRKDEVDEVRRLTGKPAQIDNLLGVRVEMDAAIVAVTKFRVVETNAPLGTLAAVMMRSRTDDLRLPRADARHVERKATLGGIAEDDAPTRRSLILGIFAAEVALAQKIQQLPGKRKEREILLCVSGMKGNGRDEGRKGGSRERLQSLSGSPVLRTSTWMIFWQFLPGHLW